MRKVKKCPKTQIEELSTELKKIGIKRHELEREKDGSYTLFVQTEVDWLAIAKEVRRRELVAKNEC